MRDIAELFGEGRFGEDEPEQETEKFGLMFVSLADMDMDGYVLCVFDPELHPDPMDVDIEDDDVVPLAYLMDGESMLMMRELLNALAQGECVSLREEVKRNDGV